MLVISHCFIFPRLIKDLNDHNYIKLQLLGRCQIRGLQGRLFVKMLLRCFCIVFKLGADHPRRESGFCCTWNKSGSGKRFLSFLLFFPFFFKHLFFDLYSRRVILQQLNHKLSETLAILLCKTLCPDMWNVNHNCELFWRQVLILNVSYKLSDVASLATVFLQKRKGSYLSYFSEKWWKSGTGKPLHFQ